MTSPNPFENNPFAAASGGTATQTAPPAQSAQSAPPAQQTPPAAQVVTEKAPADGGGLGVGDPFAMPSGPANDEDKIQTQVDNLVMCKPSEFISQMQTSSGVSDAVRVDYVVLDGPSQGKRVDDTLVFNRPLVRDLKRILESPQPYLLGRLRLGVAKNGKNAPYIFERPSEDDVALARQYLAAATL